MHTDWFKIEFLLLNDGMNKNNLHVDDHSSFLSQK